MDSGIARVGVVPAELLVSAVRRQRDLHESSRLARQDPRRQPRRVAERLVVDLHEPEQGVARVGRLDVADLVPNSKLRRRGLGLRRLVVAGLAKADGHVHEIGADPLLENGRQERRVDPAGQEEPDRNIRHEAMPERVFAHGEHLLRRLVEAAVERASLDAIEAPVPPGRLAAGVVDFDDVAGDHFDGVPEDRGVAQAVAGDEELGDASRVQLAWKRQMGDERLELGAEEHAPRRAMVIERLHAGPVATERQAAVPRVPHGEGEHPDEPGNGGIDAPAVHRVQHDFAVGRAGEPIAPLQVLPDLAEIVDFAVEHDGQPAVGGPHRLAPGGREVDDRQSPVAEPDRPLAVQTLVVRSAMNKCISHLL